MGYLANFMVYTLAMIGVIAIALIVFKNANSFGGAGKSKHLKVIDSLTIAPRKTLRCFNRKRKVPYCRRCRKHYFDFEIRNGSERN